MAWVNPKETQLAVLLSKLSELHLKVVELNVREKLHRATEQAKSLALLRQNNDAEPTTKNNEAK